MKNDNYMISQGLVLDFLKYCGLEKAKLNFNVISGLCTLLSKKTKHVE